MSKNDEKWDLIFRDFRILQHLKNSGRFEISAVQINKYREARLMTKFDHRSNLPAIFKTNNLSILPTSRGDYVIAPMELYQKIETFGNEAVGLGRLPVQIGSLNPDEITSEAAAISCVYLSGILEKFLGEKVLPTVNGRMSSGVFDFNVNNSAGQPGIGIQVENSQIEIDGGYESDNFLCLIEAKNSISDDFLIRQLYYPYRLWKIKQKKPVRPVFMVYTNGIFSLYEYEFTKLEDFNSIRLVKKKRYTLAARRIAVSDLRSLLKSTARIAEPQIPFPQADKFERIINLCELLYQNGLTTDEITETYDFTDRQTDYYINAGKYLGLIEKPKRSHNCSLSEKGRSIFYLSSEERQLKLAELILEHSIFAEALDLYFKNGFEPSKDVIVEIIEGAGLSDIGRTTFERRAGTVLSWVNWIIRLSAMSELFD